MVNRKGLGEVTFIVSGGDGNFEQAFWQITRESRAGKVCLFRESHLLQSASQAIECFGMESAGP